MVISKIILNDCLYYHLHAEQTITAAFADGRDLGISENELTKNTFDKIISDYTAHTEKPSNLILNFDSIEAIQNNLLATISILKKTTLNLALINVKGTIIKELKLDELFNNPNNQIDKEGDYLVFYISESNKIDSIILSTQEIFENKFLDLLIDKYVDSIEIENSFHSSSSIYLPKWINIKKFISMDSKFFNYAIYLLALYTYLKWKDLFIKDESIKPILVCQNLNSSYIASILSNLLKTDILILDQIGPINKMYSNLDSKIENGKNYLVVSDLVCLGTEIKIAKSLIEFLGGNYLGNISIVRIQTINPEHKKFDNTACVFVVDKNNNEQIGYKINTDLNI